MLQFCPARRLGRGGRGDDGTVFVYVFLGQFLLNIKAASVTILFLAGTGWEGAQG